MISNDPPALWNKTVHGGIALAAAEWIITGPRLGDSNWFGGWWSKYEKLTGDLIWQKKHRRGADLVEWDGEVMFTSTLTGSGIYAISAGTGERLWSRLGDRFDWLLKCLDVLPISDLGDTPQLMWNDKLLTRCGRLLEPRTGKIISRHQLEFSILKDGLATATTLAKIDGVPLTPSGQIPYCRKSNSVDLYKQNPEVIVSLMSQARLDFAARQCCLVSAHDMIICIAKSTGSDTNTEVPHYMIVCNGQGTKILCRFELGNYFEGQIDWADDSILSITTKTLSQFNWPGPRNMWVFDWATLMEIRSQY